MKMKNLNPTSGLRQITTGYICLPRELILQLIRTENIKPSELGYFVLLLMSADWDTDKYRKGFIRHELPELSKILKIPYTTLNDNLHKLTEKNLISIKEINEQTVPQIANFDSFTIKGTRNVSNSKHTDEELKKLFPELLNGYEISEQHQVKGSEDFSVSLKGDSNVFDKKGGYKKEFVKEIEDSLAGY